VPGCGMHVPPPHAAVHAAIGIPACKVFVVFAALTKSTFSRYRLIDEVWSETKIPGAPVGGGVYPSTSAGRWPRWWLARITCHVAPAFPASIFVLSIAAKIAPTYDPPKNACADMV